MTESQLFPRIGTTMTEKTSRRALRSRGPAENYIRQVQRSALWSAYGDALGWISELTTPAGLRRRTAGAPLDKPMKWTRRIGGRSGATVALPQGCYSDDSQLRLATARAIRSDGFDIEVFSKIELPVWLSYALGGGKSTTAAAANLISQRSQWFSNAFRGWTNSGGNGAAMRIQPHVWSAHTPSKPSTFLPDVIRNSICSHSHPSGLLGAVVHALSLAHAVVHNSCPQHEDLRDITTVARHLPDFIRDDPQVSDYWRSSYERYAGDVYKAWTQEIDKLEEVIRLAARSAGESKNRRYEAIVDDLKLTDPKLRGSGTLTAVAAVALIWCDSSPESALRIAANAIGTDTDTIATMAGAIMGVTAVSDPPVEVLDADLFRSEAKRLAQIAYGMSPTSHQYPDLLHWCPPKARADALFQSNGQGLYVTGLGFAEAMSEPLHSSLAKFKWQWVELETGQSLLIKRRNQLANATDQMKPLPTSFPKRDSRSITSEGPFTRRSGRRTDHVKSRGATPSWTQFEYSLQQANTEPDIEAMIDYLEARNFEDRAVGMAIRSVVNKCSVGQIGSFLSVVVDRLQESRQERTRRKR